MNIIYSHRKTSLSECIFYILLALETLLENTSKVGGAILKTRHLTLYAKCFEQECTNTGASAKRGGWYVICWSALQI